MLWREGHNMRPSSSCN
uniref:Uncharacterized protein n=1 Tax=Arundo donax TaxID=35708 RepID=A0A0A9ABH5_ARUDO